MQITFTKSGGAPLTLDIVPGTLRINDQCIDAGNSVIPKIRTARATSGSCQVLLDTENFTYSTAVSLISQSGAGNMTISGAAQCTNAIVDINIAGDGVQVATVNWKGGISSGL